MRDDPVLSVEDLEVSFNTEQGILKAVNGISFDLHSNEILGVVGESGAGKSVAWKATLRLIDGNNANIDATRLQFREIDMLEASARELRQVRGSDIGVIYQDPMSTLNPTRTVGKQIQEMFTVHQDLSKSLAKEKALEVMADVGIPDPPARYADYPHEFSGGMKQRVMIAIALACDPDLIIADEPTTALDVTIQAQILELLKEKQDEYDLSVLFITHDMGVIWEICDRVIVMYAGQIVEEASLNEIFEDPAHPYTIKLMETIPWLDENPEYLPTIRGSMPVYYDSTPDKCKFCERCDEKMDRCERADPEIYQLKDGQQVRCFLYD